MVMFKIYTNSAALGARRIRSSKYVSIQIPFDLNWATGILEMMDGVWLRMKDIALKKLRFFPVGKSPEFRKTFLNWNK